jgi:hypothetical protein
MTMRVWNGAGRNRVRVSNAEGEGEHECAVVERDVICKSKSG